MTGDMSVLPTRYSSSSDFSEEVVDRGSSLDPLPPLPQPHFTTPETPPDLSQRSVTDETREPRARISNEPTTWELLRPLVVMIGFSLLFLVLLGGAVALGFFISVPVACALIPLMLGALGGVIKGYELFESDQEGIRKAQ